MEVVFNDEKTFLLTYIREQYEIGKGRSLLLNIPYTEEIMDEIENYFESTTPYDIKVYNNKALVYSTTKYIIIDKVMVTIADINPIIFIELKRSED